MRERMEFGLFRFRMACANACRRFFEEEKGASDIVAILLVIVILIAVAAIFKDRLIELIGDVFDAIDLNSLKSKG